MSGGHYDYAYLQMSHLADAMLRDCENPDREMPDDIRLHMDWLAKEIKKLAEAAEDIEWLMSDDYGYDTIRGHCKSWELSEHLRATNPNNRPNRVRADGSGPEGLS
jgi:hypothetical protein